MNIKTLKKALPYIITTKLTPLLVGRHGVGKSEILEQFAKEELAQFFNLRLGTQDVGDLLGLAEFEIDGKGNKIATKFMRPSWFPSGGKGVLFLDEINRARKDVHQAVFQLALDKKLHTHTLPPAKFSETGEWLDGWVIVAAMNPATDDYVVTDLTDKAFVDRFCYIKFSPTNKEWLEYARTNGVHDDIVSFIVAQPDLLEEKLTDFDLNVVKPSRRSYIELSKMYALKPEMNVFKELAMGIIGPVATTSLVKHIEEERLNRLTGNDVLNDFDNQVEKVKKLSESGRQDILKAVCDDVFVIKADKPFTEKEINNVVQYALIIPKDLSFDFVSRLLDVDSLTEIVGNNKDLIKHFS